MLAEHEALVTGVDNHRLVHQPLSLEVPEQPADIVIHPLDAAQVALEIALVGELRVFRLTKRLVDLHVLPHVALNMSLGNTGADFSQQAVVDPANCYRSVIATLVEACGFWDLNLLEVGVIAPGVVEHIVRCLEVVHQEEGPALVTTSQPGQ